MDGILLITVLVIAGGAIAFIGDRLGTKIGKKRLSIFGLRPRHTSIVITIFTGVVITALTFGVMAAASQNVRTALFGMEQLNRNMRETKENLQNTEAALLTAKSEQEKTDAALQQSKADIDKLNEQQKQLQEESARLQAGNEALLADNSRLAGQNSELASQNSALSGRNDELTAKNENLTADNKALEKRSNDLRDGLITMREGDIAFRAGEIIASGVIRGNRPQEEVAADLASLAALANRNVSARFGSDRSDQDIWIYRPEHDAAVATIAKSPQDMVVRIVAAGNLVRGEDVRTNLELYPNSIIFKNNEFIIARPYELTSGDDSEAEETVMNFLKDVNFAATTKGILPDPLRGTVGVMEGAQFYDVVAKLKGQRGRVILSAYANGDTDASGPLRLRINVEKNVTQ
ncbi:hypothetical protein SELR_25830 [Selenomonas ruminantium subsp. lactilytica TAM6421]|uniref:DUF3084 domain-containing protein n=1 Tax=Selenomonas ruminantium subsp. lactilytica (strain NBRC 103574 / TAM6421) TaxID=927704 RepID=I0GU54_SELRL|nr:DUF3084 domain-containing protein [Selenomonas ruminantium]BAL84291.1 hypothetical protein SELR_25830 [Selenomonas ruminantium subsp. lactilytica TAM6421]